jgi:hypothetical protein
MNKVNQAREIIRKYPFQEKQLSDYAKDKIGLYFRKESRGYYYNGKITKLFKVLTPEILAESFHFIINLADTSPTLKMGYSKLFGSPHLPGDWKMPGDWKGMSFWFQINLEEVKPFDKEDLLPEKGIIYVFQHSSEGKCKIYFYTDTLDKLITRADIPVLNNEKEQAVSFEPSFIFYIGGDTYDYSEIYNFIPKALRDDLEKLLECKMDDTDSCTRLFGRPVYWQGEDEEFDEEFDEDQDFESNELALFFQDELDDAAINIWVPKSDLRNGVFENAFETFSTT